MHLFQNLLANALKFRGREVPRIHVSATNTDGSWLLGVHDNGIGIAEAFRERVFDMGKRLHTRDEYPGAGMGLTLCRRIVERHGGTIRIEAGQNGGSSVMIEFPCDAGSSGPGA